MLTELNSSINGLSGQEAQQRLQQIGLNNLRSKKSRYASLFLFFKQFYNPLVILLIAGVLIAALMNELLESLIILAILVLNALLGFIQEYKSQKAIESLSKFILSTTKVLRDNNIIEINSEQLVPGDVVIYTLGDVVTADVRLFEAQDLQVDEATLTGESQPVEKNAQEDTNTKNGPSDVHNMLFMGTALSGGSGKGIVVATAQQTYLGQMAKDFSKNVETNFHKNLNHLGVFLMKITIVMMVFIFIINTYLGKGFLDSALFSLALSIGITPELLPFIITTCLSKVALQMAHENVIVKKLESIENLGNMDILCTDKTGTLTYGILSLQHYYDIDEQSPQQLLELAAACVDKQFSKEIHNPIDKAIVDYMRTQNINDIHSYQLLQVTPFDFVKRRVVCLIQSDHESFVVVKGSADSILPLCTQLYKNDGIVNLDASLVEKINKKIQQYEESGFRIIIVAYKPAHDHEDQESKLIFLGFLLLLDAAKEDIHEVLKNMYAQGVDIKIISGDSPFVTKAICNQVGIILPNDHIVIGDDLLKADAVTFKELVFNNNAFARIYPDQKKQIIEALKSKGHTVGYLADGINDVPALKTADVGITVDSAVEVAKNAADIILLKKSLRVLNDGIVLGRKSFANILKYIFLTISSNVENMVVIALASIFMNYILLLPSQILLNNFLCDIPFIYIYTDNVDKEMLIKPKNLNLTYLIQYMTCFGLITLLFDLLFVYTILNNFNFSLYEFRTILFLQSCFSYVVIILALRTRYFFIRNLPSWQLAVAMGFVIAGGLIITNSIVGKRLFEFVEVPSIGYAILILFLLSYFIAVEFSKKIFYKFFKGT